MSKTTRNILIFMIIILVVFAIIFVWYQQEKTEPINTNITNGSVLNDANTGLDNLLNNILGDEKNEENITNVENTENSKAENVDNKETESIQNKEENKTELNEEEKKPDNQMTSKENKAINLAKQEWKKEWGSLDDVSFNVSIRNDGKYLVTVYDITTTQLIQGYIVDVENETVKEK